MNEQDYPDRYVDQADVRIDESKIPKQFQHLIRYAKLWCIGDDAIRTEIMNSTPLSERKEFVDAVYPHLDEIKEWCRSFHQAPGQIPDEGVLFEMVIEPCYEAYIDVYLVGVRPGPHGYPFPKPAEFRPREIE